MAPKGKNPIEDPPSEEDGDDDILMSPLPKSASTTTTPNPPIAESGSSSSSTDSSDSDEADEMTRAELDKKWRKLLVAKLEYFVEKTKLTLKLSEIAFKAAKADH